MLKSSLGSTKSLFALFLLLGAVALVAPAVQAQHHDDHPVAEQHDTAHATGHATDHAIDAHEMDAHAADAHGEEHGDAHGEEHGEGHGNIPHMANLIAFLQPILPAVVADSLSDFVDPFFSLIVMVVLAFVFAGVARNLSARKPGRLQMAIEMLVGGLYGLFETVIGPTARRYTPFLGSLFIFIWINNLFGMVPLGHAATSSFNTTTFALGLMTFVYVQFHALRLNGIGGYLHHLAGSPRTAMDWGFSLLLFPLHVLGELIKPVSLSLRLFGNIFGEDTLVATMVILGYLLMGLIPGYDSVGFLPGLPLQVPFYFLGLLSCTIQALVFTLLATVYIALWLPHDDHHAEGHAEAA